MWWNDSGTSWGWRGCLLMLMLLLGFWAVVIAGLAALFRTTGSRNSDAKLSSPRQRRRRPALQPEDRTEGAQTSNRGRPRPTALSD